MPYDSEFVQKKSREGLQLAQFAFAKNVMLYIKYENIFIRANFKF